MDRVDGLTLFHRTLLVMPGCATRKTTKKNYTPQELLLVGNDIIQEEGARKWQV